MVSGNGLARNKKSEHDIYIYIYIYIIYIYRDCFFRQQPVLTVRPVKKICWPKEQTSICGHVWGDPVPTNCRVLKADGHFTVARTLYYPYHKLWVLGSKGYLVHIAPLHP